MFWNKKKILATHNGGFHSDDVFACATLQILLDKKGEKYDVWRTRDSERLARADYVFDVGGEYLPEKNRFDHHQKGGAGVRDNGIPYAAFGLVWKHFGERICESGEVADEIDRKFAQPIDANDNGMDVFISKIQDVTPITFQDIAGLNYPEDGANEKEYHNAFLKMVSLAKDILEMAIGKIKRQFEINNYVTEIYNSAEDKRMILIERKYGRFSLTIAALNLPELLYVVYPSSHGDEWNIVAARKNKDSMESKKPFPETWAGFSDRELQKVTGISTAKFCHNGRFLCVAEKREDAIALANLAIKG
jgi:uncharacterized UPF0160 family protein